MSITGDKGCTTCKWRMEKQTGYSNYTVIGSIYTCLKDANPGMPYDDETMSWEESSEIQKFGETCESHEEGDAASFDVDGEITIEDCSSDPEVRAAVRAFKEE